MFEDTLSALGLKSDDHKKLNLALQGGGAHGAYTWGVLDALLEDENITFDMISGTSAGAVNAVALASGFLENGSTGAREKLEAVWNDISKAGDFFHLGTMEKNAMKMFNKSMMAMFNPFDMNPLDFDPLRDVMEDHIDFEALRAQSTIGLYIAATEVSSGKAHIFETHEITIETVLASACLPFVSKTISIEGVGYWDGGCSANPAIRPVISHSDTDDTLLVQISPMELFAMPNHMQMFSGNSNQLSFSQSLRRELELIEEGREVSLSGMAFSDRARRLARHRFHLIDGSPVTSRLNPGSEMTPDWSMLSDLFTAGRTAAEVFLTDHRDQIGHKASVDLKEHFDL